MIFPILCQLFPLVSSINPIFLPCDTDVNTTKVDCSDRHLTHVPIIRSDTITSFYLSRTKILQVGRDNLSHMPNLRVFVMADNCRPAGIKASLHACSVKISPYAFSHLLQLQVLNLSGNSLTSLPWLPANLKVLNLQRNHLFNIMEPLKTPHLRELYLDKNCFYANPCLQPLNINESVFRELTQLKTLSLAYSNLTSVPKGLPRSLEHLDLRENTITEILEGTFADFPHLTELNMAWNCQRCDRAAQPCFPCPGNLPLRLYSKSFYTNKSSLTFLSLKGNSLSTFPQGLFQPLKNLTNLDLSDNFLSDSIQNGSFFAELTSLSWISLIYNYNPKKTISELSLSPHIGDISGLQQLLLSGNFFHSISGQSFEVLSRLKNLKTLELRMNFINTFDLKALKRVPSLNLIDLSQNILTFLSHCSRSSAERGTCSNQNTCNLGSSNPVLHPVKPGQNVMFARDFMDQLHRPEMSQLFQLQSSSLWKKFCQKNVTFDLSQNNIIYVNREVLAGMEHVVCLDLSFNYMSQTLRNGMFDSMTRLAFLNLSYNRLDLYYAEAFGELNSTLKVLDLSNNDFHFKMRGMGHRLTFIKNLVNLEVLSLANNGIAMRVDQRLVSGSLKQLYFNGNDLNVMWSSENKQYIHFFQNLTSLTYLDISDNKLRVVSPEVLCNLPRSLQNLSLSNNRLNYFPWENISALTNLRHLDLSQNFISFLPHTVIQVAEFFSLLDLSHNRINYLPQSFFLTMNSLQHLYLSHNQLKQFDHQFAPFKNGSTLQTLSLHANPFNCDCSASWFVDFLHNTLIDIPYLTTEVKCEYPESQRGKTILSMEQPSCQDMYGSLASVICSFLVVAFTVLPLLKHLYGWDLWYSLQVLWADYKGYSPLSGRDVKYNYDAFVVFDTNNLDVRDWVYNELLLHLENSAHKRFCLCLEERDWIPGFSCIENLHNAVSSSMKTMFVLSNDTIEPLSGVIRQAFFMVQQRLLDEKVGHVASSQPLSRFPNHYKYLFLFVAGGRSNAGSVR